MFAYRTRSPVGDQRIPKNEAPLPATFMRWGSSPFAPINQISRPPFVPRKRPNAILEPSGETFAGPDMSSTSAIFRAFPARIGIDHTVVSFSGLITDATIVVESGYHAPNTQSDCTFCVPGGNGTS